ncbi:MAG TPA: LCP family protein [Clostridiales bacterium]|nr:LCP family protein [Clostridiales bacterium]
MKLKKLNSLNKKQKLALKLGIGIAVLLLVIFAIFQIAKVFNWINQVDQDPGFDFDRADETFYDDDHDFEAIYETHDASSLEDLLFKWATNGGEKMSNKNVINVLLIGIDSESGLMDGGNTDAIMIASLDRVTKKITLVSVMRDSFVYMDINGQKRFFKINAAYSWGGPATLVKIVEDNYKIEINNFVCVDFATFPKIIDALGGINVDVQPYEAKCVTKFFGFAIPSGEQVLLDGKSALGFSRIRKCDADGDISRTRRQRSVIMSIISKVRDASNAQISSVLDEIFPNIKTNYKKSEMLTLGSQALLYKWADYEIDQITSPAEENCVAANIKTHFVWVVDYPVEAQKIQMALYGKSNIVLDPERVIAFNLLKPKDGNNTKVTTTANSNDIHNQSSSHSTTENAGDKNTTKYDLATLIPTLPNIFGTTSPHEVETTEPCLDSN